eukprot:Em0003g1442a
MSTYDFVNPLPDECCCLVTKDVLLEPHLTLCCGAHLSKQVAEQFKAENRPCPNCGDTELSTVLDKSVQKKVLELRIRCSNRSSGCPWQGSVAELDAHLAVCDHEATACPYTCNAPLTRSTLKHHVGHECPQRPTTCKYCNHRAPFSSLAQEHHSVCPGYPVTCPNGCGRDRIERRLLPSHIAECPMAAVQCSFSPAGCVAKVSKGRMQQHVDDNVSSHLSLVASKQAEMMEEIESLKKMSHGNEFTDGPNNIERELSEVTSRLDKLEEQWSEHLAEQSQLVSSLQTALNDQSEICAQKHGSAPVEQPKEKKSTDTIEQPAAAKSERKISVPVQQPAKTSPPQPAKTSSHQPAKTLPPQQVHETSHAIAEQHSGSSQQPVKASIETEKPVASEQGIRARMKMYESKPQSSERQGPLQKNPPTQPSIEKQDPPKGGSAAAPKPLASQPSKVKPTQLPPVDLIMTDFAERKENEDFWFSDPFYTHQGGYKLCLKVIPGGLGVGAGKDVSISVYIMKGEFDDSLKWPFKGDITLQLLDWAKEEVRCEKVISFNDKVDLDVSGRVEKEGRAEFGWGHPEFLSHAELASGRAKKIEYLRNNSLKFRVPKIVTFSK